MATLTITGSGQTLTLSYAKNLMAGMPPKLAVIKIPGRTGNIGQGLSRESVNYTAIGIIKTSTEWNDFITKLAAIIAGQASATPHATYTHKQGTTLLDSDVWISDEPKIKTREGSELVLGDWEVYMMVRE